MKVKSNFMGNDTKIRANTIAMVDNNKGIPLDEYLGNLSDLNTTNKSNLVGAINELTGKGVTNLFSGDVTTNNTEIQLSDNYTSYDFIIVVSRNDYGASPSRLNRLNTLVVPVALLNAGGLYYYFPAGTTQSQAIEFTATNKITTRGGQSQYYSIVEIYGVKL